MRSWLTMRARRASSAASAVCLACSRACRPARGPLEMQGQDMAWLVPIPETHQSASESAWMGYSMAASRCAGVASGHKAC